MVLSESSLNPGVTQRAPGHFQWGNQRDVVLASTNVKGTPVLREKSYLHEKKKLVSNSLSAQRGRR